MTPPAEPPSDAAPTPPPPLPVNPIVAAAQDAVVGLFDALAEEWPKLMPHQTPPTGNPQFTADMMNVLKAQLRRALGIADPPSGGTPS